MFYKLLFIQPNQNQEELFHLDKKHFAMIVKLFVIPVIMAIYYFNVSNVFNVSKYITWLVQSIFNWETLAIILSAVTGIIILMLFEEITKILLVELKKRFAKKNDKIKKLKKTLKIKEMIIEKLLLRRKPHRLPPPPSATPLTL